ncbi:MAG: diphosphomevalonate decarboxylase, partial [Schleiferiaceae bacterium]|nr:diphosphomevalonate decarboxylase [Schleiferiaceae bacterium]
MTHTWSSPSNIALVKYWGKHGQQLPSNPSISFTLSNCRSTTSMTLKEGKGFTVALDGVDKPAFAAKIQTWFDRIDDRLPWLKDHHVTIESSNSLP